jgi:hypothetical protein
MTKAKKGTAENPVEIEMTIEEALRDNPKKEEILRFIKEQNQLKKEEK